MSGPTQHPNRPGTEQVIGWRKGRDAGRVSDGLDTSPGSPDPVHIFYRCRVPGGVSGDGGPTSRGRGGVG